MITLNYKTLDSKILMSLLINKLFIFFFLLILSSKLIANPNITARTAILIDYHSDEILFELDSDAQELLQDQVAWFAGFILSLGYVAGAYLGVKLAVYADPRILRWFLFTATLLAGGAALMS